MKTHSLIAATCLALFFSPIALAQGHGGHDHGGGHDSGHAAQGHGGHVSKTKAHHFEVVFLRDGIRVYVMSAAKQAIDPAHVQGAVKVEFQEKGKKSKTATLEHVAPARGAHEPGYLHAKLDLSKVSEGEAEATFKLQGLPDRKERAVSFEQKFHLARLAEFECPMKCVPATDRTGNCPKCGMALARKLVIYACPMHPQVAERSADAKCWICEMPLGKTDGAKKAGEHGAKKEHGKQGKHNDHGDHGKHGH